MIRDFSCFVLFLLLFVVCGCSPIFDEDKATQELEGLYASLMEMDYEAIDLNRVDSLAKVYSGNRNKNRDKIAICHLLRGAKLYSLGDNMQALDVLKRAELNIDAEHLAFGRLCYYLSRILAVDNPEQSKYYAQRLLVWAEESTDLHGVAFGNKLLMNLEEDIDSAVVYRNEAVKVFDLLGDTLMREKTNARFAIKFTTQLPIDSVISMVLPFYERIGYERDADALATAYLLNNRADEALPYIKNLRGVKGFEFQYYNDMAVYYSQKGDFERSLAVYDSAFQIYQQQALQILDEQIARVNGEYDKKLYDQHLELQRYRTWLIVLGFALLSIGAIALIVWLVRALWYHREKSVELEVEKEKLEVVNEELVDTSKKQTQKLYAVSDICKQTYASIVMANPDMVKVISRSMYDNLRETYP